MNIDVKEILQNKLAASLGLDKYQYIMTHVMETDVSADEDFQRIFNGFYIVRRNEQWRKVYYSYFEEVKKKEPARKPAPSDLHSHGKFALQFVL